MKIALIALLLLTGCAHRPFEDWSKADTAREVAWQALHIIDWGQTLDIADNPDRFHELNPLLGKHPSRGQVNRLFVAGAVAHPIAMGMFRPPYRAWLQYVSLGITGVVVTRNYHIGLRWGF